MEHPLEALGRRGWSLVGGWCPAKPHCRVNVAEPVLGIWMSSGFPSNCPKSHHDINMCFGAWTCKQAAWLQDELGLWMGQFRVSPQQDTSASQASQLVVSFAHHCRYSTCRQRKCTSCYSVHYCAHGSKISSILCLRDGMQSNTCMQSQIAGILVGESVSPMGRASVRAMGLRD